TGLTAAHERRRDRRALLGDDDVLVRRVAGAGDGVVVRVAVIGRPPAVRPGLGRREGGRGRRSAVQGPVRAGEDRRVTARRVIGAVQVEGDGARRVRPAGDRGRVADLAADLDAGRGLGRDPRVALQDGVVLAVVVALPGRRKFLPVAGVAGDPAIRA